MGICFGLCKNTKRSNGSTTAGEIKSKPAHHGDDDRASQSLLVNASESSSSAVTTNATTAQPNVEQPNFEKRVTEHEAEKTNQATTAPSDSDVTVAQSTPDEKIVLVQEVQGGLANVKGSESTEKEYKYQYTAPDGKGFDSRTEYRKYLFAKYFSFSNVEGEFLVKRGGDIDGQAFSLSRLIDCEVQLLDHSDQILADYLENCRIFIGPSAGSVFLRNCINCSITVAAKQLRTRDCRNCRLYVYSKTEPVIEMTEDVEVRCFNGSYDGIDAHFQAANLDPLHNNWEKIHDFSKQDKDLGPGPHFTLFRAKPTPWNATGKRTTARPRLLSETSVSMC